MTIMLVVPPWTVATATRVCAGSPSVQITLAKAEVALRAKAAGTSNPAYQRHLLKFLRLLDWARS